MPAIVDKPSMERSQNESFDEEKVRTRSIVVTVGLASYVKAVGSQV